MDLAQWRSNLEPPPERNDWWTKEEWVVRYKSECLLSVIELYYTVLCTEDVDEDININFVQKFDPADSTEILDEFKPVGGTLELLTIELNKLFTKQLEGTFVLNYSDEGYFND